MNTASISDGFLKVGEGHRRAEDIFDAEGDFGKTVVAGLISWTIQLQIQLELVNPDMTREEFLAKAREILPTSFNFDILFQDALEFLQTIGWSYAGRIGNTLVAPQGATA